MALASFRGCKGSSQIWLLGYAISTVNQTKLFGHCIATWYAMSRSLVKLTEIVTSLARLESDP